MILICDTGSDDRKIKSQSHVKCIITGYYNVFAGQYIRIQVDVFSLALSKGSKGSKAHISERSSVSGGYIDNAAKER